MTATIISGTLILEGCDKQPPSNAPSVNNISDAPLSIKDLTTGVKYEKSKFPKIVTTIGNQITFDYSFFGKERLVYAEFNDQKIIYSYHILLKGDLEDIRQAIEEKISTANGKRTQFACEMKNSSWGGVDWENKTCSIVSRTQRLLLEERKPVSQKPSSVSDSAWTDMHMGKVLLEDTELSRKAKEKTDEQIQKKYEADKARASKDI